MLLSMSNEAGRSILHNHQHNYLKISLDKKYIGIIASISVVLGIFQRLGSAFDFLLIFLCSLSPTLTPTLALTLDTI